MLAIAAKQDAFEESIRLKNQFRNLDEDEVEFLDSVLESTRAHEEAVKKETREQLELFRRQQEEADRALMAQSTTNADATGVGVPGSPTGEESLWTVNARKRKRLKEKEAGKLVKQRKPSLPMETPDSTAAKTSSLQPTAGEGKPSASADRKGHGIEIPARNPLKLAEPRAEVTNTAVTDERPGKLRISTGNPKPSLLNFGLGSYDSDDEE